MGLGPPEESSPLAPPQALPSVLASGGGPQKSSRQVLAGTVCATGCRWGSLGACMKLWTSEPWGRRCGSPPPHSVYLGP